MLRCALTYLALNCVWQTETAAARISNMLSKRQQQEAPPTAVRVGIKARGCNGLSYTMDYAHEKRKLEEEVLQHGEASSAIPVLSPLGPTYYFGAFMALLVAFFSYRLPCSHSPS